MRLPFDYLSKAAVGNRPVLLAGSLARVAVEVFGIFLTCRLAMVFPATAIGAPGAGVVARIRASWIQMRGQVWLLIRAGILVALPILIVMLVLLLCVMVLQLAMGSALDGLPNSMRPKDIVEGLLGAFTPILLAVLDAGVASWLYAWVTRGHTEAPVSEP